MKNEKGNGSDSAPIKYEIKDNNCWLCTSHSKNKYGYSRIYKNNKCVLLHRFMYEQKYEEIPKGLCACHSCDNPACINPDHIFIGTLKDNSKDMSIKGRSGGSHPIKKFRATNTINGYEEFSNNQHEFARKYNLNVCHLNSCLNNKRKSHKGWNFIYI